MQGNGAGLTLIAGCKASNMHKELGKFEDPISELQ
jgi:hypothetical protein